MPHESSSDGCSWALLPPPAHEDSAVPAAVPEWLRACRALRSRVLFENGRRPQFGPGGTAALDADPLDFASYHWCVTAAERQPIATLRLSRLADTVRGMVEHLLGGPRFEALLGVLGAPRAEVWEFSRWVVDPAWRGHSVGAELLRASFAEAQRRGARWLIARAGRQGAHIAVRRCGMLVVPGLAEIPDPAYDDASSVVAVELEKALVAV